LVRKFHSEGVGATICLPRHCASRLYIYSKRGSTTICRLFSGNFVRCFGVCRALRRGAIHPDCINWLLPRSMDLNRNTYYKKATISHTARDVK
jgi:hypothetical protein